MFLYATSPDGNPVPVKTDASGNLLIHLNTAIKGEDQEADRLMVEFANTYQNITTGTTASPVNTTLSNTRAYLHSIIVNSAGSGSTVEICDDNDPSAGGGVTGKFITLPTTTTGQIFPINVKTANGLILTTKGTSAADITVIYRKLG